jgi:acyl carrier protein
MKATSQEIMDIVKSGELSLETKNLSTSASLRKAGLDSLDASLLFLTIQEKYNLKVADDDVARLDTVDDIVAFVNQQAA